MQRLKKKFSNVGGYKIVMHYTDVFLYTDKELLKLQINTNQYMISLEIIYWEQIQPKDAKF